MHPTKTFHPSVFISATREVASRRAAEVAAEAIRATISRQGAARIMVGTGNSQLKMVEALVGMSGIEWSKVEAFHLDEYVGLPESHPASFRRWIRQNFAEKVKPRTTHFIDGTAPDLDGMLTNYASALLSAPVDVAFVGIGENGHIAFNDPHVADFDDPLAIKKVRLDDACRRQQVGEGHFPDIASVPAEAISVSCTGLFRAKKWICCVPDRRKAQAVRDSLEGPISTTCPGSLVRRHPDAAVFLDAESASLLSPAFLKARGLNVVA